MLGSDFGHRYAWDEFWYGGQKYSVEIEEQAVDCAEHGQDFAHLIMQVFLIFGDVTVFFLFPELLVITQGMQTVDRIFGMVPVDEGIVETDL